MYEDIERGNFNRPELGAFFFCAHKLAGLQNEEGKLLFSAIRRHLRKTNISLKVQRKIELECVKNRKTPEATALKFEICVSLMTAGQRTRRFN